MIDLTTIPSTSPLLEAGLLDQLGQVLAKMKLPVTLKAVVDLEDKNCQEMAAFLKGFCALSDLLSLEL